MSLMLTDDAPVQILQQSQHSISTASHVQAVQPLSMGMSILIQAPEVARGLGPQKWGCVLQRALVEKGHPKGSATPSIA